MNAEKRKRLKEVIESLERAVEIVIEIGEQEREAFDNLPDSLQNSEKGDAFQEAADAMEEVESDLRSAIDAIADSTGGS